MSTWVPKFDKLVLLNESTDLHHIWHFLRAIYTDKSDFRKVQKPGHNGQDIENTHAVTFSLAVTKRLNILNQI